MACIATARPLCAVVDDTVTGFPPTACTPSKTCSFAEASSNATTLAGCTDFQQQTNRRWVMHAGEDATWLVCPNISLGQSRRPTAYAIRRARKGQHDHGGRGDCCITLDKLSSTLDKLTSKFPEADKLPGPQ